MRERTVTRYLLEFTSVLRTLERRVLVVVSRRLAVKAELLTCPAPFDVQTLGAGPVCLGLGGLHTTKTIFQFITNNNKIFILLFHFFFSLFHGLFVVRENPLFPHPGSETLFKTTFLTKSPCVEVHFTVV